MTKNENNKIENKEVRGITVAITTLIMILIFLAAIEIWIYFLGINNIIVKKVASVIPYPVAIVDSKIISAARLDNNLEAAKKFYENQDFSDIGLRIDFSTPDGKKRLKIKERRILTKMIEDSIIENEANRRGIKLTDQDISTEVSQKMEEYGDKSFLEENMKTLYGWEISDFEENMVKPDIYAEKLYADMRAKDDKFTKALAKIKQARAELDKSKDFESIVAKYSEGDSVKNRGDLGWFGYDEMLPEIATVISSLEKGKISNIIESSLGYHIIKIEDKKTENDIDKFHIRQIFVRIPTLPEWLSQKEKEIRIFSTIWGYQWDESVGEAQFTDENIEIFEENLEKNSADDASVIF